MANCVLCTEFDNCPWRYDPNAMCSAFKQRPMTNGDRIRAVSDEELAKQIADWNGGDCPIVGDCMPVAQNSFTCEPWKCWLDWLKQECKS